VSAAPRTLLIAAALLAACPGAARASAAEAAFRAGQWAAVTPAGRSEATAEALALSARALLIRAAYQARSREAALGLIAQAERDVEAALALAPDSREALLQRSAVIGYRAQFTRSPAAGRKSRDLLRALTERHGYWADGWLALGVWHGESVATVGPFLARTALGASADAMTRNFERAAMLDPQSPVVGAWRGLLALRLDAGAAPAARIALTQAAAKRPRDGYEALLRQHAIEVLDLLERGDTRAARARAEALAGFAQLKG